MSCADYDSLHQVLVEFDSLTDAIICPFASDMGAGLGMATFALFVFAFLGLGLAARTQHHGPVVVTGILCAGIIASSVPGRAAQILAIILFLAISAMGMYIYQRANSSL